MTEHIKYDKVIIVKRDVQSLFLCKESDDMSDTYLNYLYSNFLKLKEIIISKQYKVMNIVHIASEDYFGEIYQNNKVEMNQYMEGKLYRELIDEFTETKILDSYTQKFVEDSKVIHQVLWAYIWYSLSQEYFIKENDKSKNIEEIFSFEGFMTYLTFIKAIKKAKEEHLHMGNLYYLLENKNNQLMYMTKELFCSPALPIYNKEWVVGDNDKIYSPGMIFVEYLEDIQEKKKIKEKRM